MNLSAFFVLFSIGEFGGLLVVNRIFIICNIGVLISIVFEKGFVFGVNFV